MQRLRFRAGRRAYDSNSVSGRCVFAGESPLLQSRKRYRCMGSLRVGSSPGPGSCSAGFSSVPLMVHCAEGTWAEHHELGAGTATLITGEGSPPFGVSASWGGAAAWRAKAVPGDDAMLGDRSSSGHTGGRVPGMGRLVMAAHPEPRALVPPAVADGKGSDCCERRVWSYGQKRTHTGSIQV